MAGVEAAMRRHTPTPYDVTAPPPLHCAPPAYFAAHSPTTNGRLEPSSSGKKIWTDRLRFGGSSKEEDKRESVTMHEYNSRHHKYGTLSGGSALSKSMKYAETWLYGSVAVKPTQPRPSLFMYPDTRPAAGYAIVMCSCPEFYAGTTRSKKSSASPVCKKCGGSRRAAWDVNSPSAIRGFGTVRLPPPKHRPQLPAVVVDDLTDPYDLMRKSRLLGVSTPNLLIAPQETNRSSRAKSSSPPTIRRHRSQSPLTRHKSPDRSLVVNNSSGSIDPMQRKSILECDVNAYELITKYLKPTSRGGHERASFQDCLPEDDEELSDNDYVVVENVNTTYSRTKTRSRPPFHNITKESNKNKFDSVHRRKREITKPNDPVMPGGISIGGQTIRIFNSRDSASKLPGISEFVSETDGSGSTMDSLTDDKNQSWFIDTDTPTDNYHHPTRPISTVSRIPASTSMPKRPPRKSKSDDISNKRDTNRNHIPEGSLIPTYCNTTSSSSNTNNAPTSGKNRVNFSLDVPNSSPNANSRRNSSLTSSSSSSVVEIKSILKKPNMSSSLSPLNVTKTKPTTTSSTTSPPPPPPPLPTGSADNSPTKVSKSPSSLTFSGPNSKQDGQMSVSFNKTGSAAAGNVSSSKNFSLQPTMSSPTLNNNNTTARKKKQVQFKVNEKTATGGTNAATVARVDFVVDPDQVVTEQLAAAGGVVSATGSVAKLPTADDSVVINRKLELDAGTIDDNANDDRATTDCDLTKSNKEEEKEKEREIETISYRENDKSDNNDSNAAVSEYEVQQQEHKRLQFFGDTVEETRVVNHKTPFISPLHKSHSSVDVTNTGVEEDDVKVDGERGEQEDQDGPKSKVRLHRSLSDRLSPGSDPSSTPFNDTMRLRTRVARRDARDSFPGDDCEKPGERRLLSPGRPRPKEPPPPPPPPAPPSPVVVRNSVTESSQIISLQVNVTSPPSSPLLSSPLKSRSTVDFNQQLSPSPSIINISVEESSPSPINAPPQNTTPPCPPPMPPPPPEMMLSSGIPPPKLPPRQIFRFTKEEIEKINQNRVRNEESKNLNSPLNHGHEMASTNILHRSVEVTNRISISCDNETVISSWNTNTNDEFIGGSDETDRRIPIFLTSSDQTSSLERQTISITSNQTTDNRFGSETLIKVLVPPPDTDAMVLPKEMDFFNGQNCTIVKVCSSDDNSGGSPTMRRPKTHPNRRTSIMITGSEKEPVETKLITTSVVVGGDYNSTDSDKNKLTISVGGGYNKVKGDACSDSDLPSRKEYRSNIVVGAEENKGSKTLVTFDNDVENVKNIERVDKEKVNNKTEEMKGSKTTTIDLKARQELDELIRQRVDPVEAVRKNLIPHVCGLPKEQKEKVDIDDKYVKETDDSHTENEQPNVNKNKTGKLSQQSSVEDDVFTAKEERNERNSDCYVCSNQSVKTASSYYNESIAERDKQDDEVEVRIGLEFDSADENHYEMIRDPIYEEISDTPPPLPLSPPPTTVDIGDNIPTRSIFEGATKYDILNYLVGAKERGIVIESEDDSVELRTTPNHSRISSLDLSSRVSHLSNASDSSEDSCNLLIASADTSSITSDKVRKSSAEIERNDSGVGSETSKCSRSRWQHVPASCIRADQHHSCEDCDQPVETQVTDSGLMFAPLVCRKCAKRRAERREIITEIVETEEKYGRDLRIIQEEFYKPMLVAGLLTPEQLSAIFLNVEELIENNAALSEKLRDALEIAIDQGDEDLLTVNIGRIFVEAVPMLHAFESYCTRQGGASLLLANLEKEKELLRIFLRVSQMENSVLRRMNLNSFLMVPVQRVTKYPLLLARLYKVSPAHHVGREALREAQHKIELHLEHINSLAKDISTTKLWRRISIINGRRASSETDMINIKLRKVAVDVLEWNHDEVRFAVEGKLLFTQPTDNNWRRGRTIKLTPINAMLVTLGKPTEDYQPDSEEPLAFPRKNGIRDATLLLLKEKSGRYGLLREPLFLDRCIVCCEADWEDYFEIQELPTKDTFIFKADDGEITRRWYRQLQYHSQGLGAWRKRRNALANIMINGMQLRS